MNNIGKKLAAVAFNLPVGAISDTIEAPYGFHLLKVEARTDDQKRSLEEVHEPLRALLEARALDEKMEQFLTRMRDNSEWCVKPKYQHLVPIPSPTQCETL